ncbi:hypothetical protein [Xanthomonas pisi]|uniref:hypothetical protein n=1 Tax=Xanthomonas pisi TaxID=56457 RepID=UPI0011B057CE|nr:hypothetical protein [Xanthomonas pisi]
MSRVVKEIRATGTSGEVAGKPFFAVARGGKYTLHSEDLAAKSGKPLRYGVNKVLVDTLEEAADLLATGSFHIRVYNAEHKQSNLRAPDQVVVT